jgi:hypothetical protein
MIVFYKFLFPLVLLSSNLIDNDKKELVLELHINNKNITLNNSYENINTNIFKINKLKFYISNLKFYLKDKEVLEYHKKHILIDIENEKSLKILIPNSLRVDEIIFNLGVDTETNKSGAKSGDLDPVNGMYWTWNSGYINFKLEGIYKGFNEFSYHIGGFMKPHNTLQLIKLNLGSKNKIVLNFDEFFNKIDFNLSEILSPGKNAVKLSTLLANSIN